MNTITSVYNLPILYVNGLGLSWVSNTTLSVATGQCRSSNNAFDLTLSTATTINAVINGVNGLDTGTFAASSVYYVHLIGQSINHLPVATLLSLSATAPVLPSGYDLSYMIGCWTTDGSTHFNLMTQLGTGIVREYTYDAPPAVLTGGSSATWAAQVLTGYVPAIAGIVKLVTTYTPAVAANTAGIRATGSSSTNGIPITGPVASKAATFVTPCLYGISSSLPSIDYKVTASDALTLNVLGFTQYL